MSDKKEEKNNIQSNSEVDLRSAMRWYMLGFTLLGFAVGYFAGSSQSPVIGTLLPLLFGLVGGTGGLYLARADIYEPKTMARIRILGKVLALFIIFTVLGSYYGIALRTEQSIWSFFSLKMFVPESEIKLPDSAKSDPRKAIELAMLRARIRALGAPRGEEREILQRAAQLMDVTDYVSSDTADSLQKLASLTRDTKKNLTDALNQNPYENTSKSLEAGWRSANQLNLTLGAFAEDYVKMAEALSEGEQITSFLVKQAIGGLRHDIRHALYVTYATSWMSQYNVQRKPFWELDRALFAEEQKLGHLEWMGGGSFTKEIDRFLKIFYSRDASTPLKRPSPSHEY
jgi:hypothetical protein